MPKGLFIGRFQPFHLGHLSALLQALRQVDFLWIGIGSSQYSETAENPFSAEARQAMIQLSLEEAGIPKTCYGIRFIPDLHDNVRWPAHVKALVPDFDLLFLSNQGLVDELFKKQFPKIQRVQLKHELPLSGTQVREKMKHGGNWQKDVPKAVARYLSQNPLKIEGEKENFRRLE